MSCVCIAGSNQTALDLVAKVLTISGMNVLEDGEAQTVGKKHVSDDSFSSIDDAKILITPRRRNQVIRSARSTELSGWADIGSLNSLAEWMRIEPSLCFVLVSSKVTDAIGHAIEGYDSTFDCAQIIRSWHQSQQKLLHFFYRHRDRCLLVDSQDCLENAQDFVLACQQSFSVQLKVPEQTLSVWPTIENSVTFHFVNSLLESYPEALSLENEIATCVRKFGEIQDPTLEVHDQISKHLLLSEYRVQRQQSKASLKHLVEENNELLSKIDRLQTENEQLFIQYQKSQRKSEISSEEADADRQTISRLKAELELARAQIAEVSGQNDELSKKNEHLFFDLYEAQRSAELAFERNIDLEAQVNALHIEVNNSQTLFDLRQVDLDQALHKNIQLQEKQVEVEAENDILLSQFQQSLVDLELYFLKSRALQGQVVVEQEGTKALEARLNEVTVEYGLLDQAHVQWRAERETLLEQIELKQNAMVLQSKESEWISAEHKFQLEALQERQSQAEADIAILTSQLQQSLKDVDSYILKNRTLQNEIAVEQESTKALEARLQEVKLEYDTLDQAHIQWRAERGTLLEQIELKQNAMSLQNEEFDRVSSEHKLQLAIFQEKQVEVQAESDILLSQFQQSLIDLESYILKNRNLQNQVAVEQEGTHALEARLNEVTVEYGLLDRAHVQWRAEREILIEQIELKQNALVLHNEESERISARHKLQLVELQEQQSKTDAEIAMLSGQLQQSLADLAELKDAHATLLIDLSQEQKITEQQFSQNEQTAFKLKTLEFEKDATESRLLRILQKYPMPVVCDRIEVLGLTAGKQMRTQWQVVGLETGKYHLSSLLCSTIIEGSALGLIFSRLQAANNGLVRWPAILETSAELVLSPVGDATTGPIRAETWLSLATTDLDTVVAWSLAFDKELRAGSIATQCGQNISNQMLNGLEGFKRLLSETKGTFRYDRVRLKRATVNDDYENLWLEFENISYNDTRSSHFECRVACSKLISKRFGSFPKIEFPYLNTQQPLSAWYAESRDDFGEKLELRFALPDLFDVEVWNKLTHDDQGFIVSLLERLPSILADLELEKAELHRPWPQWQTVVEYMTRCLTPTLISEPAPELSLTQLNDLPNKGPLAGTSIESATPPHERNTTATARTIALGTAQKRSASSAFLSYLKES